MKFTFCIPSKNNLRYLKSSIQSIKENSAYEHDIIVFVDSDNDGTESWLQQRNITYIKNDSTTPRGIAYAYNRCIESSNTSVVCLFHADMYMARGFDINLQKHLQPGVVVCATRIEPPLHPPGLEKIVRDFGMYPEEFDVDGFSGYVEFVKSDQINKTTKGIFAPWVAYKSDIIKIGLHDENFHSYHEDSDIFNRMLLCGMQCVQSRDSLVYHFTCRGGQFQDGVDKITQDQAFHAMKRRAMREYLRKWGSWIKNDEYHCPILIPKYDIAYVLRNATLEHLVLLEPWCSYIGIPGAYDEFTGSSLGIVHSYISQEQPMTSYNLHKRVGNAASIKNDIVVEFDCSKLTDDSFQTLQMLPQIIQESGDVGEFVLDIFNVKISKLQQQVVN